jgi:hypothetical protein
LVCELNFTFCVLLGSCVDWVPARELCPILVVCLAQCLSHTGGSFTTCIDSGRRNSSLCLEFVSRGELLYRNVDDAHFFQLLAEDNRGLPRSHAGGAAREEALEVGKGARRKGRHSRMHRITPKIM